MAVMNGKYPLPWAKTYAYAAKIYGDQAAKCLWQIKAAVAVGRMWNVSTEEALTSFPGFETYSLAMLQDESALYARWAWRMANAAQSL